MATDSIRLRAPAASRPRPQSIDGKRHFEVNLYGDLPRFLRALGLMLAAGCLFAEGLLLFRLWSMLTGEIPISGLESRLFLLSGRFLAPFASFETVQTSFN